MQLVSHSDHLNLLFESILSDQEQETCRKSDSEELEYDEVDDLATAFNKHLSLEDHEDCTDEKRHKWKKLGLHTSHFLHFFLFLLLLLLLLLFFFFTGNKKN